MALLSKLLKPFRRFSALCLLLVFVSLAFQRLGKIEEREIAWDVLGYYLYLPAGFIYNDPALEDPSWLEKINREKELSGTLYQVSSNDQGKPIYFFLMGMSWLYLPFFLIAHYLAPVFGFPADGFSAPYQLLLVIGGLIYTLAGMIFFRKIMLRYLSDPITGVILLIIYLGTNAIHHFNQKNLETVNMLFSLACLLTWLTIRWYENPRIRYMAGIAICAALMVLVKPSEVFILLIPLLWNFNGWKNRYKLFGQYRLHLLVAGMAGLIMVLPQISYWYFRTGHFIYDSYKNAGIGLDLMRPHISEVLFSFRKGWLLYTPVMIAGLAGWYFLWKRNRALFIPSFTYFLVSFYIISSWSEWWYGASFSTRPLIVTYPFLGLSLGYLIREFLEKRFIWRAIVSVFIGLAVTLNIIYYVQFRKSILDPYRTTPAYFKAVFLKGSVPPGAEKLLLVNRGFGGKDYFSNPEDYNGLSWFKRDFDNETESNIVRDADGRKFYRIREDEEFALLKASTYAEISQKDHVWFRIEFDARFPDSTAAPEPCLVTTMERREGVYGYKTLTIGKDSTESAWKHFSVDYLSPEIRSTADEFKCYFWKRSKMLIDIDNLSITVFEPKRE
jgi:hypothetical protein